MKVTTFKTVKEETEVPFDIKEIIKDLIGIEYINDADTYIDDQLDYLTPEELFEHRTEILAAIYNHNEEVMKDDLQNIVEDCLMSDYNYQEWKPTKEQLIEAINKYYE